MTDTNDLMNKKKELKENLLFVYKEAKELFIIAEEIFPEMRLFAAPTLEHRDALEHIMRYLTAETNGSSVNKEIEQLDKALGHELRAYFDTADYVSIVARDEIRKHIKKIPLWKIKKHWQEYSAVKCTLIDISNNIAAIRQQKSGSIELVKKYKSEIDTVIKIYTDFIRNVEPKFYT